MEARIYKIMNGGEGIPKFYEYGVEGKYNILILELLGKDLEELLESCHGKFSIATGLMIAEQTVIYISN